MFSKLESFLDVNGIAQHVLHLLQTQGATGLDTVRQVLSGVKALTGKDYVGVFAAINAEKTDVEALIAAVKAEFNLA